MNSYMLNIALIGACLATFSAAQFDALPQCPAADLAIPKSVAFLGSAKSIQVGTITFSYHEFGPSFDIVAEARADGVAEEDLPEPPAPLLLIHGYGSTQYDWPIEMMERLSDYRKVVIFDNPRIGYSNDTSTDPLTTDSMASATLGLIQALQLNRPDILGYSMGGDIALTLAVDHGDQIGGVVAVASSFGGPSAPQPPGGISSVLSKLETVFLAKYAPPAASSLSVNATSAIVGPFNNTGSGGADPYLLFFPQGSLDPANCNLVNDYISLMYAVGLYPLDQYAGYAVPDIIPSIAALVPQQQTLSQQADALLEYHSQISAVKELLPDVSNQIMYVSGIQDNVIPVTTQLEAVQITPGAWLQQIPDGGHGVPFLAPAEFAASVTDFLDKAQALGPVPKSYYNTTSSGALKIGGGRGAVAVAAAAVATAIIAAL